MAVLRRWGMNRVNPILTRYAQKYGCAQALGLVALRNQSKIQQELRNKYFDANMSQYATGHSYMQVPSEAVMENGYKRYIINKGKQGVSGFGLYDKSQFSDLPVEQPDNNEQGKL